jgi:hypothetical protein
MLASTRIGAGRNIMISMTAMQIAIAAMIKDVRSAGAKFAKLRTSIASL